MEISLGHERSIPVFRLSGRLDARGADELDDALRGMKGAHAVLDMAGVAYISSMGIRSLLVAEQTLRKAYGALYLAGLSPTTARVLEVAGVLGEFQRYGAAAEALTAAAAARDAAWGATAHTFGDRLYRVSPPCAEPCALEIWGPRTDDPFAALSAGGEPADVTLEELGIAFGRGGLGSVQSQDSGSMGQFIAIGNVAGVIPEGARESDFVVSEQPAETGLCVAGVVGFAGPPTRTIEWTGSATVRQVIADLVSIVGEQPLMGFVLRTKLAAIAGIYSPASGMRAHGVMHEGSLKLDELKAVARVLPDMMLRGGSIALYLPATVRIPRLS